jgi:hypothetical protein
MKNQFVYTNNDIHDFKVTQQNEATAKLITMLVLLEQENPGILAFTLRMSALVSAGWKIKSSTSNPEESRFAQKILDDFLLDIKSR